ncbi:MAG: AAA family ATPase [Negativicutes bacterium]|nr:AAA family ATPase [Negativicutes bacterium]
MPIADINFASGLPVYITPQTAPNRITYASRVLSTSTHTITISIPYDKGRLLLWPVGARLEISLSYQGEDFSFTTEVIQRDLGEIKSYTIMRPYTISRSTYRPNKQNGMSRVIAITSGKGGVGKTTFTINLAIALAAYGQRVFIIDADLGTANVDVLLRLTPQYNITHLLTGEKNLLDITISGPGNIAIIPGGSGMQELTQLSESQFSRVINSFNQLDGLADIILLDTGAGISKDVSNFLLASDEIIVVTTTEPHAITDAYAILKVMKNLDCQAKQMLVVNKAESVAEANSVAAKLTMVLRTYLNRDAEYLGYIIEDRAISRSLKEQTPLILSNPQATAVVNIREIAAKLLNKPAIKPSGITGFVNRMFSLVNKKTAGLFQ